MKSRKYTPSAIAYVGVAVATAAVTASALVFLPESGFHDDSKSTSSDHSTSASASGSISTGPASKSKKATRFTISSSGDILPHLSVNHRAKTANGYDYARLLRGIQPWIEGTDLALCALEVPIVPPGEEPSNYPAFGSPPQIADSLKTLGWDGCALATNHSMDRGFNGVTSTIDNFERVGLGHAGTARSAKEASTIQYYTVRSGKQDVVVAHLSASTLTNGVPFPKGKEWSWNVVGKQGHRKVSDLIADAQKARKAGASIVVVSMHWGEEYRSLPTDEQMRIGQMLADSGKIDLVFGNHSHVPEPVAKLNGGPEGRGMPVVWSMGNTLSGQRVENHGYGVVTGLFTTATVEVPAKGKPYVADLTWTSLAQDKITYEVFPLEKLELGARPQGTTVDEEEIKAREQTLHPLLKESAVKERINAPKPQGTLIRNKRR